MSMIILIITIFLFSIASACASDANTTATAMVDEQTTEEVNEIEVNNPASDILKFWVHLQAMKYLKKNL